MSTERNAVRIRIARPYTRALRLYERMGFSVEGRRSECLLIDGQFIDELTMAVILAAPAKPVQVDAAEP